MDFATAGEWLLRAAPLPLLGALLCMLLFLVFEALSMRMICKRLGYRVNYRQAMAFSTSDAFYSGITPSATGGQPASALYMLGCGIDGGTAGFALVLNLIAYTAALFILGLVALLLERDVLVLLDPSVRIFLGVGLGAQVFLAGFMVGCMFFERPVIKLGNALITLLSKLKLVRRPERLRDKLERAGANYRTGFQKMKADKLLFIKALLLNIAQRGSQVLVTSFVCLAIYPEAGPVTVFALQMFVLVGCNFLPLPGGSGGFEFLYLNIFFAAIPSDAVILATMMLSRLISYYLCIGVSGLYLLIYRFIPNGKATRTDPPSSET